MGRQEKVRPKEISSVRETIRKQEKVRQRGEKASENERQRGVQSKMVREIKESKTKENERGEEGKTRKGWKTMKREKNQ